MNSKFLFKGWILILDDEHENSQHWIPKYVTIGNTEKLLMLLNFESQKNNDNSDSDDNDDDEFASNSSLVYRIDNFINKDSFLNYWKSKSVLFDQNNNSQLDENTPESSSSSFSFSGLFKKSSTNSTSKQPSSSLKRAKSGIQLDRKKLLFKNVTSATTTPFKKKLNENDSINRISLPPAMRPSRSHESLSHLRRPLQDDISRIKIDFSSDSKIKLNINQNQNYTIQITHVHSSLLQQENCFELRYSNSNDASLIKRFFFMCRTSDERDKWIYILNNISNSNQDFERRHEDSLELWLLEAKGTNLSVSSKKRYFAEIVIDNLVYGRTISKEKKDILFWGESFDFNLKSHLNSNLRIDLYQELVESKRKKNQVQRQLLGSVYIPISSLENNHQYVEKWFRMDGPNDLLMSSLNQTSTLSSSNTTTNGLNNSKDSITIRIKLKYNSFDILPLNCYKNLIDYLKNDYVELMKTLEANLNVRMKENLSNTLVRISFKLQYSTQFLTDLVMNEICQLEDTSLIFRGNSIATKSMESYMKLVGESYLKQTLSDLVRSVMETNHDLEIDPAKMTNQNSLQSNREELIQILHLVCGRVFNSCAHFPRELKQIFCRLREECKHLGKSDEMCDMLISASIFLRFICPAILSPNLFNLTQEYPQEKAARKLTLAAKTLQTIANFSKFGGKESYMSFDRMNKFVDEHSVLMREFLRNISTLKEHESSFEINVHCKNNNEFLFNHDLIDIGKQLSILHTILSNSLVNFEANTLERLSTLQDHLQEITHFKTKSIHRPLIYDNLYHHEVMQLQHYDQQQMNDEDFAVAHPKSPENVAAIAQDAVPSVTNLVEKELSSLTSSPAQSPRLKQQYLKMFTSKASLSLTNLNRKKKLIMSTSNNANNEELNDTLRKLQETEEELKREQDEKNLIEIKYNQQKDEYDKKLKMVIQRLAQVEEELADEKLEIDRILRAKQVCIERQSKKIESLANRLAIEHQQRIQCQNQVKTSYLTQDISTARNYALSLLSASTSSSSTTSSSQSMTHNSDLVLGTLVSTNNTAHYLRTSEL